MKMVNGKTLRCFLLTANAILQDILLYIGGNLVVGKQDWSSVERRFLDMGFDRAFPPGTRTNEVIESLARDFAARAIDNGAADR